MNCLFHWVASIFLFSSGGQEPQTEDALVVARSPVDPESAGFPRTIAADRDNVFWATSKGQIFKAPKTGGDPMLVLTDPHLISVLLVNTRHIYWFAQEWVDFGTPGLIPLDTPTDLAQRRGRRMTAGEIWRVEKGGQGSTLFLSNLPRDSTLALDDKFLYWRGADGQIFRKRVDRDSPGEVVKSRDPLELKRRERLGRGGTWVPVVADAGNLYWADLLGGAIMFRSRTGADAPKTLLRAARPIDLAVDEDHVYWISAPFDIMKTHKP